MAVLPGNGCIDAQQFIATVERTGELIRLHAQVQRRKSMLVFGPEAVGKTRLLLGFVQSQPLALLVTQVKSPRELLLALVEELRRTAMEGITLPADCASLGVGSLKGLVRRTLEKHPFLLVLDHLAEPSRVLTSLIKYLNYFDRTPIVFAARTPHMEDIGALRPMCAAKSEQLELKEFPPHIALEFVRRQAAGMGLYASNLDHVFHQLVEWSSGNPGSMVQMLKMAHLPRYRVGDQIKAHVLYLDYHMGRRD